MSWFDVDKKGLAKLLEKKGKEFLLFELIQNAWDQNVTKVGVTLERVKHTTYQITVEDDDPEGFKDLSHAYTLFAESEKKADAEKRGRFNLGEKLVLAICHEARIVTTKGGVSFDDDGRHILRTTRPAGSMFQGFFRMTAEEFERVCAAAKTLLPPTTITTIFNGEVLQDRLPVKSFRDTLPTEIGDDEGVLRRTARLTTVSIHEVEPGETAMLYEMGIPVVEIGDRWHINIAQKIPLNMDRDNVTPAYLREVRTKVLNEMFECISAEDANASWVRDASSNEYVSKDAMEKVMDMRFGDQRVIFDPSDPEANKLAVSKGFTVIHGSMLNGKEWENVKRDGLALPAGQVTPSPKPYGDGPDAAKIIAKEKWTEGMTWCERFSRTLGKLLLGLDLTITFVHTTNSFGACYGKGGHLDFNVFRLGKAFFDRATTNQDALDELVALLIHEFGHESSGDHLSSEYHDALCRLGAKLYRLNRDGTLHQGLHGY